MRSAPLAALLAALLPAAPSSAGAPPQAADAGFVVEYRGAGGAPVVDHVARASIALAAGESPHPHVAPADLVATWRTHVVIDWPGRYAFHARCDGGTATLRLGERTSAAGAHATSGVVALEPGEHELEVELRRAGDGPVRLVTSWELELEGGVGFLEEPLAAARVRPAPADADRIAHARAERRGRVLLAELGCTGCHAPPPGSALERRDAPDLLLAARGASVDWLSSWIADPHGVRATSPMPDLFAHTERDHGDAEAIAHFLARTTRAAAASASQPEPASAAHGDAERGRTLYHTVGCVACHGALASPAVVFGAAQLPDVLPSAPPRAPFGELAGRYDERSLAALLADPLAAFPSGRMPDLRLAPREARSIAAYLVGAWGAPSTASELDDALAERGAGAWIERGCEACHVPLAAADGARALVAAPSTPSARSTPSTPSAPPLAELAAGRGCLAPDAPAGEVPRYALAPADRSALELALARVREGPHAPAPADAARVALDALSCLACHARAGEGGPSDDLRAYFVTTGDEVELGDEGRLPPDLSGVGTKLEPSWIRAVLSGAGVARPHMAARMPRFPDDRHDALVRGLAALDGVRTDGAPPDEPRVTDERVRAGRLLAGESGMNCISCHRFGDRSGGNAGVDMTAFAERLRYPWYRLYMQDPARFKPGTRMPAMGTGGLNSFEHVLGGDAYAQADALWAWFTLGGSMPPPEGIASASGMQLDVGERPRVFRTFLEGAGSRGIAIGFPAGLHFAFDAENARLVDAWSGAFLNASGAWAGRGGSVTGGRGPVAWKAPPGPALVVAATRPDPWPASAGRFRGYALDDAGAPTLRYALGDVHVRESLAPYPSGGVLFRRTFQLDAPADGSSAWMRLADGERFVALGGCTGRVDDGMVRIVPLGSDPLSFAVEVTR